jgi:hypothetical protein
MSANPKNLRLHLLAEEDALVQTDDGDGIFAPANRDPDGQGHNEFTRTNLVVLAGTRSDRRCLVERSGFGVRCR